MSTFEVKKKRPAIDEIYRMSPVRYFIESKLHALSGILHPDSVLNKNYFIEINEFYIGGAVKEEPAIKLVQLSDLHLKTISSELRKRVAEVNAMQPGLILFTGDIVDSNEYLPVLQNLLQLFHKNVQKVAILGNWERMGAVDLERLRKIYADNKCLLLLNDTKQFHFANKTVSVTGIDDYSMGYADFDTAVKGYRKSDYHIVLSHCPAHRDVISAQLTKEIPIDFILSGHTHGGQVKLFGYTPELPTGSGSYVSGWYNHTLPALYVSKGLGTSIVPLRLGCTAEIGVFNLKA